MRMESPAQRESAACLCNRCSTAIQAPSCEASAPRDSPKRAGIGKQQSANRSAYMRLTMGSDVESVRRICPLQRHRAKVRGAILETDNVFRGKYMAEALVFEGTPNQLAKQ